MRVAVGFAATVLCLLCLVCPADSDDGKGKNKKMSGSDFGRMAKRMAEKMGADKKKGAMKKDKKDKKGFAMPPPSVFLPARFAHREDPYISKQSNW